MNSSTTSPLTVQSPGLQSPRLWSVTEIAKIVGGEVVGQKSAEVSGIQPLEIAGPSDLSFFAPTSRRSYGKLFEMARRSKAGALIVKSHESGITVPQIVCKNPLQAIIRVATEFRPTFRIDRGIHPQAVVDPTAKIGRDVSIGAFACIGQDVEIGDGTTIHPHVVIYPGVTIGKNCVLHSGAVIREFVKIGSDCLIQNGVVLGGDGFGYATEPGVANNRIPHIGTVVLEDRVDIGANSTIDRATLGETRIGDSAKIDNLVMIGHNCVVGQRSLLCGQVGVSGSTTIGNDVVLGGQVGVADHVVIGDKVRAAARTGITGEIESGIDVAGFPAKKASVWRRQEAILTRLPDIFRKMVELNRGKEDEER